MRVTLSLFNNTNSSYEKEKASNSLTSFSSNVLSKDVFTPSFKGVSREVSLLKELSNASFHRKISVDHLNNDRLISAINNPELLRGRDETLLHIIAGDDAEEDVIPFIIKKGANINALDFNGRPPLHIAAINNKTSYVKALLDAGADMNIVNNGGDDVLLDAISSQSLDVAKFLLDSGFDVNRQNTFTGRWPIHYLSHPYLGGLTGIVVDEEPRLGLMKTVLSKGNDVNARDNNGVTPLMNCSLKAMNLLLDNGADVSLKDKNGNTALPWALERLGRSDEIVKKMQLLIDHGIDIDAKNNFGKTALYRACKYNNIEAKKFLLNNGADSSQIVTPFPGSTKLTISNIKEEVKETGLRTLPKFVECKRLWDCWSVKLPEEMELDSKIAIKLDKTDGEDIHAFKVGEVNGWLVDTKEGLAKLVKVLNEQFSKS